MSVLDSLTIALFAAWCASELLIGLLSLANRLRGASAGRDRFSYAAIWCAIVLSIGFAFLVRRHVLLPDGFGDFAGWSPLLGALGVVALGAGLVVRVAAVVTLRRQFTTTVTILDQHALVEAGLYRAIRHPAYLGLLLSLLGMGLALGNWLSLAALVLLPLAGTLYRIRVEEQALLRHFGPAYAAYARRTWRLLPGLY